MIGDREGIEKAGRVFGGFMAACILVSLTAIAVAIFIAFCSALFSL